MASITNKFSWQYVLSAALFSLGICANIPSAYAQTLGIAAIVNDDVISLYDLEASTKLLIVSSKLQDTPDVRRRLSRQVLNRLIDEKLKMQEARRMGVQVAKQQLEKAYADMEKRNKLPRGGLTKFFDKNGVDKLALLDQIEASLAWGEAINRKFRAQIIVSDEEVDEVVNEIKSGKGKPEYLTAEIYLPVNNPNRANEVLNNANRLIAQLRKGTSFETLARNYSQSASAAVGGDLGWVRQGQLAKELDEALIHLKKRGLSQPVRTVAGYHIILKRNERMGVGLPPSKEKLDLRQVFLPLPASANNTDKTNLTERAKNMAKTASSCKNMEKLEAESGSPLSGSLGVVDASSLPIKILNAVKNLPVGTASEPFPSKGGVVFLMVCKRTGTSTMELLRPQIRQRLFSERLDISARGYLRDLRQSAFLDTRI